MELNLGIGEPSLRRESPEDLMLAEFAHRISNDMTVAIAELQTCRSRSTDVAAESVLASAIDRLSDICGVQRRLMLPEEGAVDLDLALGELAKAVVRARSNARKVSLVLRLVPIRVESRFAWRLATVVAELLTNALKHGLARRDGQVSLTLDLSEDSLSCTVADDGSGAGDWRAKGSGHGHRIVQGITDDMGGTVERLTSTLGTEIRLVFPRPEGVAWSRTAVMRTDLGADDPLPVGAVRTGQSLRVEARATTGSPRPSSAELAGGEGPLASVLARARP